LSTIRAVCVYCGSSAGHDPAHAALAHAFGSGCADRGIELVFGGGAIGLMGVAADAALAAGGRVTGIIPSFLERPEIAHPGVSEMITVDSMHARKQIMFERADGFVSLPGGLGTLDETVEVMTWKLLDQHDKPIVLLDQNDFWGPFRDLVGHFVATGFAGARAHELYSTADSPEAAFALLEAARAPRISSDSERL
jgi:hypothetical protein